MSFTTIRGMQLRDATLPRSKIDAAFEATSTLMMGRTPETVIARYREHVAANTKRLSAV